MMKPFDLEAAKAGAPVCTRNGRKARIICFDRNDSDYNIVALIENTEGGISEGIETFNNFGEVFCNDKNGIDLMMATVKHEGWFNIYPLNAQNIIADGGYIYATEKDAKNNGRFDTKPIATIKVEWEE